MRRPRSFRRVGGTRVRNKEADLNVLEVRGETRGRPIMDSARARFCAEPAIALVARISFYFTFFIIAAY